MEDRLRVICCVRGEKATKRLFLVALSFFHVALLIPFCPPPFFFGRPFFCFDAPYFVWSPSRTLGEYGEST